MNKNEMKAAIIECVDQHEKIEKFFSSIEESIGCNCESQLFELFYETFDKYLVSVEKLVGDEFNWINWYIYDNDCGRNGYDAKASNWKRNRKIKNITDLVAIILADTIAEK